MSPRITIFSITIIKCDTQLSVVETYTKFSQHDKTWAEFLTLDVCLHPHSFHACIATKQPNQKILKGEVSLYH